MTAELRVLGEVELRVRGFRVEVGHARQRSVLVALVMDANRVVTVDRLLDRVWAQHVPHRARDVVRNYVSRLRRPLAEAGIAVERRSGGYVLHVDPDSVDVHRFHRLVDDARAATDDEHAAATFEQALGLWRGEAFAGLDTPWLDTVRQVLDQDRFGAEADRIDVELRRGGHAALLPTLRARATEHPLDERVAAQYMLALYRAGRQADALTEFDRVRTRLADEFGADPGPSLRSLHRQILTSAPSLTPTATAPTPVPRQLPALPTSFAGRSAELDALDARPGAISTIGGPGGIGKTSLAVSWAYRHLDRFPDGQLFVDLRGFSPDSTPMDPAVAVRGFLTALGVEPSRVPSDAHAQAALYRSLVADRRMLVVLDNALDAAQVEPLLPGGGTCTVVVTSRSRPAGVITGHGARHLALDVLSDGEARELLTRRLGTSQVAAEPAAVAELTALGGGFPLVLSIIAGWAHTWPELSLSALAAELRDGALHDDDPTASLSTVLSWSHRALTTEQAAVFGLLGTAPGPDLSLAAAAALTGMPAASARAALRALEQVSLLTRDRAGRYRMHDLIRRYATDTSPAHLSPSDQDAALRRLADFYLHTARTGDALLEPGTSPFTLDRSAGQPLGSRADALAWFEAEHASLLATQHAAAAHGWHEVVWRLAWTLKTFHHWRGHLYDDLESWRVALVAADHLGDPMAQALSHRFLGRAQIKVHRHEEALLHLEQARVLSERIGDRANLALAHQALAWAWELSGEDVRALEHAVRALELHTALDDRVREAGSLNNVGWYLARLGRYEEARSHCEAALVLQRGLDHRYGAAHTLDSLGYIHHRLGDYRAAVDHYEQALVLYRDVGYSYAEADTLDHLGASHAALGRHADARDAWQEALRLFRAQERTSDADRVQGDLDGLLVR
ncbi:DNA-binding SARP family transcriptional activator [Saccharothrix carnea]|uniref:DNA-binding SARP family transcriptional activator n=1 Tax=Saccharothrix carnea TaxID=1280637 RepID=A0A2P8I6Y5_SACCR|nr:BTAD domain-containing putative transcriptional regulator [Saccharothrix carnea]PSL54205.1 DNA-binding SARP family transcriptional activator [Saccharothrix carnea]